jgi:PAS domain-containing protein
MLGELARIARGERVHHYETVRVAKDGRSIGVSLSVSPVRSPSGVIVGASKIARDITERKSAEKTLLESEGMARGIIDTALDVFIPMDEGGHVIGWNPQAEAIFGWSRVRRVPGRFSVIAIVAGNLGLHHRHQDIHTTLYAKLLSKSSDRLRRVRKVNLYPLEDCYCFANWLRSQYKT